MIRTQSILVSNSPILLALTMWLTWTIRPVQSGGDVAEHVSGPVCSVSLQRLRELASRLAANSDGVSTDVTVHQLVRFNLYNFGEESVLVRAIALKTLRGESLNCELVPSVVVAAGTRYPVMVEVTRGPVVEAADIEVDIRGLRFSVSARGLPSS